MRLFIYEVGEAQDANIIMIWAESPERADELYAAEMGLSGVDDADFDDGHDVT